MRRIVLAVATIATLLAPSYALAQTVDQDFLVGATRGELAAEQVQGSRTLGGLLGIAAGVAAAHFSHDAQPEERNTYHGLALGLGFGLTAVAIDGAGRQASPDSELVSSVEARYRDGFAHGYQQQRTGDVRVTNGIVGLLYIGAYAVTSLLLDDPTGGGG